jgi:hypothetical protein
MLKRNGQVASRDDQLSLFDFARSREQGNLSDAIRTNGGAPLAGVPAEDGSGIGGEKHPDGSFIRGTGADNRRNGSADEEIGNGAEADPATGARSRLGDDSREIHSSPAGRESLNANNYRIRKKDALGRGSLKQKCRDNFAAIELTHRLDAEGRDATEDEKRVLVKYVGWGGIPQVFADQTSSEWASERERLKELLTHILTHAPNEQAPPRQLVRNCYQCKRHRLSTLNCSAFRCWSHSCLGSEFGFAK